MQVVQKDVTVSPQPTAIIIKQPRQHVVVEQPGCCCVPSTASESVKAVREKRKLSTGRATFAKGVRESP